MLAIRPGTDEYGAFYAGYIARIADGQWLTRLEAQPSEYREVLSGVDAPRAAAPMAPGKWSLLQGSATCPIPSASSAFACCGSRAAKRRGSRVSIRTPGSPRSAPQPRTLEALLDEFASVRAATLALLPSIPDAVADRRGTANGNPMTVRACAWMIAGHAQHHLDGLRETLPGAAR